MPTAVAATYASATSRERNRASGCFRSVVGAGRRRSARSCRSAALLCSRSRPRTVGVAVARYYDPTTSQFLTRDPLEAETRDAYGYAGNDPINGSDPTGLKHWWDYVPVVGQIDSFAHCQGSTYDCAVMNFDPAYFAVEGYANEVRDVENGCSGWQVFKDGAEAVAGVAGTAVIATGAAGGVGRLGGPGESPAAAPMPPGYDPETWTRNGASRESEPGKTWWDPQGGEWRWHAPDKYHPDAHWDYNPWDTWNSPWQHVAP